VLLVGCCKVMSLMLARARARENEIGLRLALGASRGRVARLLFAEALLLGTLGGGGGSSSPGRRRDLKASARELPVWSRSRSTLLSFAPWSLGATLSSPRARAHRAGEARPASSCRVRGIPRVRDRCFSRVPWWCCSSRSR
jgi:hypothetical protein